MLPVGRIITTGIFFLIFYILPLVFSRWLVDPNVLLVDTTLGEGEFYPIDRYVLTLIGFEGTVHSFIGFKIAYMLCLRFSNSLVKLVKEIYAQM